MSMLHSARLWSKRAQNGSLRKSFLPDPKKKRPHPLIYLDLEAGQLEKIVRWCAGFTQQQQQEEEEEEEEQEQEQAAAGVVRIPGFTQWWEST